MRSKEPQLNENDDNSTVLADGLRLRLERLEGEISVLRERVSAQDAADEQRRAELEVARSDAAGARAELATAQVRVEEWRRLVAEARDRLSDSETRFKQLEQERTVLIALLERKPKVFRRS